MYINPPTTIPISIKGNNTIVNKNFDIPHVALIPKNNISPNIHIMQIANNSDNIFLPPYFRSFAGFNTDLFCTPSFALNAGFFSIFSINLINCILFAVSILTPRFSRLVLAVFLCFQYNYFMYRNTRLIRRLRLVYFSSLER